MKGIDTMSLKSSFNEMKLGKILNEPGLGGETYLTRAIKMGQHDAIKEFLELGCDIKMPNAHGETPIYAALAAKDRAAIKILLDYNDEVVFMKKDGKSFKHNALKAGMIDVAERAAIVEKIREAYLNAMSQRGF